MFSDRGDGHVRQREGEMSGSMDPTTVRVDGEDRRGLGAWRDATASDHIDSGVKARGGRVSERLRQATDLRDSTRGGIEAEDRSAGARFRRTAGDDDLRGGSRDGRVAKS